ncbi:hypothetical protein GCM10025781_20780 [Kocuria gwangalliensis]|uniref:Uncharacterized protein n=1 Tax=Kocuria gwangalliensis TaxID=501592 RepID=A0ABP8XBA9_9MICC
MLDGEPVEVVTIRLYRQFLGAHEAGDRPRFPVHNWAGAKIRRKGSTWFTTRHRRKGSVVGSGRVLAT